MHLGVAQIEEAVLQAHILLCLLGGCHFKGERLRAVAEDFHLLSVELERAGRDFGIDRIRVAPVNAARDGDDAFAPDFFEHLVIVDDHLCHTVFVAQVDKGDAAVVADVFHPSGQTGGGADVALLQFSTVMGPVALLHIKDNPFKIEKYSSGRNK